MTQALERKLGSAKGDDRILQHQELFGQTEALDWVAEQLMHAVVEVWNSRPLRMHYGLEAASERSHSAAP